MIRTPLRQMETTKSVSDGRAKATTKNPSDRPQTEVLTPIGTGPVRLNAADPDPAINSVRSIAAAVPRQTKAAMLRARLAAPGGVSLEELMQATGWQAHTLRAALSGLRKSGLTITRRREGGDMVYAIEDRRTPDGPVVGAGNDASAAAAPTSVDVGVGKVGPLITEPGKGAA